MTEHPHVAAIAGGILALAGTMIVAGVPAPVAVPLGAAIAFAVLYFELRRKH